MFRFVSFVWNESSPEEAAYSVRLTRRLLATRPTWKSAFQDAGMAVFCSGTRIDTTEPRELHHGGGVVLGTIFRNSDMDAGTLNTTSLTEAESDNIVDSGGMHLVHAFWGRYVAFLYDIHSQRKWILRDPMGGLPCFRTSSSGVDIFFSDMQDCHDLDLGRYSINWSNIEVQLVGTIQTRETGLREVFEVQGGECIERRKDRVVTTAYWNPLTIARSDRIDDLDLSAKALRETTRACVHAWASRYKTILLNLSGGLDSSIVLSCLSSAPSEPDIACITHYSEGPDSDEREFARLAAHRARCELIEQPRKTDVHLEEILKASMAPNPQSYIRRIEHSRAETKLARERCAWVYFTGSGGDEIFHRNMAPLAAADFLYERGIRSDLLRIALDAADTEGLSLWRVLGQALQDGLFRRRWSPTKGILKYKTLLSPELLLSLRRQHSCDPTWCRSTNDSPPGKLWQIYTLSIPTHYYDPFGTEDSPEFVSPLRSQPLVELVLRIPTYVLRSGGRDRALARAAFAADVPSEILRRRWKGGIEEHMMNILRLNLPFARDLLPNGVLVNQGLLDRQKVSEALSDHPSGIMKGMSDIYRLLSIEAWVRTWAKTPFRAAA